MTKKTILFISQAFPYPADGGGKIKSLLSLLALAKKYRVHAVFISEYQPTHSEIQQLKTWGVEQIDIFYKPSVYASVKDDLWGLFKQFSQLVPHYMFQYAHPEAASYLQRLIESEHPSVIHIDHLNLAQYLPKIKKQVWILEHHNLEFYLYWTRFRFSKPALRKLYLFFEMLLTYRYEAKLLPLFDHIFAISKEELLRIKKFFNPQSLSVQPLVYPLSRTPKTTGAQKEQIVLFVGSVIWPPNEDAMSWFLSEVWPHIISEVSAAKFVVVGRINKRTRKLFPDLENVTFVGHQPDLEPYLQQASVFVLPFRMGGGVRLKSLTAFSHGIPVVSTPLGVEGLQAKENQTHYLARTPSQFASRVIELLKSPKIRQQMSAAQRVYVSSFHSPTLLGAYLKKYDHVATRALC